ncbi:MAG: DUF2238 domain-containing protein [Deltaproteobacteria bacterium]|nr:DUF2238 domain-containing protein [Deltaproteobacteria bacterium]
MAPRARSSRWFRGAPCRSRGASRWRRRRCAWAWPYTRTPATRSSTPSRPCGYNEFPLFAEWRAWGWSRNHYDRVVHLAHGLLIVVPVHEVLRHVLTPGESPRLGLLIRYLAVSEIMGTSMIYELIESR